VGELGQRAGLGAGVRPIDLRRSAIEEALAGGRDIRVVRAASRLNHWGNLAAYDQSGQDVPPPLFPRPALVEARPAPSRPCPVILGGPDDPVIVNGNPKPPLRRGLGKRGLALYNSVKVVVDKWPRGFLTWADLEDKSHHGGARRLLRGLAHSDPDWADVFRFAGGRGRRGGCRLVDPSLCFKQTSFLDD
jgi:hypothetical protein